MASSSNKTVNIYLNSDAAQESLKKLQGKFDTLADHIKQGQAQGKLMVGEIAKLKGLESTIDSFKKKIDQGLTQSFNQLQKMVASTRAELKRMSEDDPGFKSKTSIITSPVTGG